MKTPRTSLVRADATQGFSLPALFSPSARAAKRTLEFFTAHIRNPHTRKAYARAATEFSAWCEEQGIGELRRVQPMHVAAYIEDLQQKIAAPSVKVQLAAIRMLFDWLVVGQIVPTNPASAVRGPQHVVKQGKTPVLCAEETRDLLASIDTRTPIGLRDRALIALLVYSFARVGAALKMRTQDVYTRGRRSWIRLHEKGGKRHEMPCHHNLEAWLSAYIAGADLGVSPKAYLFRASRGRSGHISDRPMSQSDVYRMIQRRALAAGIQTKIGCHTFRATGITEYLRNGGKLEIAQQMANHESPRTTGLYDRRNDQLTLDEVERILI